MSTSKIFTIMLMIINAIIFIFLVGGILVVLIGGVWFMFQFVIIMLIVVPFSIIGSWVMLFKKKDVIALKIALAPIPIAIIVAIMQLIAYS